MDEAESVPCREDFKVAIVCAVALEAEAVEKLFDKSWKTDELGRHPQDRNTYSVGRIGTVLVVVVWLHEYGKTKAATAVATLRFSYTQIEHALVVGICGGVPNPSGIQEIVLGDVVISTKLQEYDQGKQYLHGYQTTRATRPRKDMGAFINKLQASGESRKTLKEYSAVHLQRMQSRDEEYAAKIEYPGSHEDILFGPSHLHKHYPPSECYHCSSPDPTDVCEKAIDIACSQLNCKTSGGEIKCRSQRQTSSTTGPSIYFGIVGSGDTVMKSAKHRDQIAQKENIIAFEMEGAGVNEEIESTIVIKGVCDYADSHKNKKWQYYAAAVAAACTGAFLEMKEEEYGYRLPRRKSSHASIATIDSFMSNLSTSDLPAPRPTGWGNGGPMSPPSRSASGTVPRSSTSSSQSFLRQRTYSTASEATSPLEYGSWIGQGAPVWNGLNTQNHMPQAWMSMGEFPTSPSDSSFGGIDVRSRATSYSMSHLPNFTASPPPQHQDFTPTPPIGYSPPLPSPAPENSNQKPAEEAAKLLLNACTNVNNLTAATELLSDPNFNINAKTPKGKTVAHLVLGTANVTTNRPKALRIATAIQFLCGQNADLAVADDSGMTPLHWCVKTANLAAVRHLIDHRVPINPIDKHGKTPLYLLGIDGSPSLDMVEVLIRSGAGLMGKKLPELSGRPNQAQLTVRARLRPYA